MVSVPFKVKKVMEGWAEATGLLLLDLGGGRLMFQFETKDAVLGIFKSGVKEVPIELADVLEVVFAGKWTGGGTLTVKLVDMVAAKKLPGQASGVVELKIARKDADAARELASDANLEAAEARLKRTTGAP